MSAVDAASLRGDWSYPTRIRFGAGRVQELADACRSLGIARPLVVTDPMLADDPIGRRVVKLAMEAGLEAARFVDLEPNPKDSHVKAGVQAYRRGVHDGVVAFGGGSAIDAAKAIALMTGQTRPLFDFEDVGDNWTRADAGAIAPIVAIPTTAGTGAEVGRVAVITDDASQRKVLVFHPRMMPGEVILDPELTLGLPPALTAWTGIDALSHSLEALCAPGIHPMADGIACEAIRLIHHSLEAAVEDGSDLVARAHMLSAACMGAVAFQKGLGAMHAMAHPIGGLLDAHHGLTIAVVMPYVLDRNIAAIEPRLGGLARTLGMGDGAGAFVEWVRVLRKRFEIPERLDGLGVRAEHVRTLAARAAVDPSAATNPVPLDEADYGRLFEEALAGPAPADPLR